MIVRASDVSKDPRHWLAINGSSCARSATSMRWPIKVAPSPEILVGFMSEQEATKTQNDLLTAPPERLPSIMKRLVESQDIIVVRYSQHEPQTDGQTLWEEV